MQTTAHDTVPTATPPCGERAARALCQRVASLRAALDAVHESLPTTDALQAPVCGALTELDRLARDVRALLDWTLPAPLRPLDCSLEELGLAAVDALQPDRRGRTIVAVERPAARVHVDGPLASKSLARLLDHGFATGADSAGLQIEPRDHGFRATASFEGELVLDSDTSVAAGLAEALARRDLARLGARIEIQEGARPGSRRAVVEFTGATSLAEVER